MDADGIVLSHQGLRKRDADQHLNAHGVFSL